MSTLLRKSALLICLLFACASVAGCGPRGAKPADPGATGPEAPASQIVALPGQPKPTAWTGQGLATPYISGQGELELTYGDARGTIKLGTGKGQVAQAVLAPDRQQLVYVAGEAESQRIYYVNTASGKMEERELTEARDAWPAGRLAWSPCSQYLAIDSGTSAAVRPLLLLKPARAEVIGSCAAFGFAWSPAAPSRLAIAIISDRQLMPITELDRTTDVVVVDLPSGRMTSLAAGGTTDCWGPLEWTTEGLKAEHSFMDFRKDTSETRVINLPARPSSADAVASGSVALPAGVTVRPEVDFRGQLLLVDNQGAVQRKLTDARDGRVLDAAESADGSIVAYVWWAKGEDLVRVKTVRLPDLSTGEVALALSAAERRDLPAGAGPMQLAFAAQGHVLLASFYGRWRPDDRVQVYDLDSGGLLLDQRLWMPLWAPGQRTSPLLVAGALVSGSADLTGSGAQLSLVQIDVASGTTTVVKPGSATESWWPQGFNDPSHLRCLQVTTAPPGMPEKVAEAIVALPE